MVRLLKFSQLFVIRKYMDDLQIAKDIVNRSLFYAPVHSMVVYCLWSENASLWSEGIGHPKQKRNTYCLESNTHLHRLFDGSNGTGSNVCVLCVVRQHIFLT